MFPENNFVVKSYSQWKIVPLIHFNNVLTKKWLCSAEYISLTFPQRRFHSTIINRILPSVILSEKSSLLLKNQSNEKYVSPYSKLITNQFHSNYDTCLNFEETNDSSSSVNYIASNDKFDRRQNRLRQPGNPNPLESPGNSADSPSCFGSSSLAPSKFQPVPVSTLVAFVSRPAEVRATNERRGRVGNACDTPDFDPRWDKGTGIRGPPSPWYARRDLDIQAFCLPTSRLEKFA